jgi:phosphatidylinositol kinase/protein kinase (PI-3  family)
VFLEELWEWSRHRSASPLEKSFILRTESELPKLIDSLGGCSSVEALSSAFERLLLFADTFESHLGYKYSLGHLSPLLLKMVNLRGDCVGGVEEEPLTIPGLPPNVNVAFVEETVYALSTKTRPKKLRLRGSDGKKYDFLVKGNENLNIDSAVMMTFKLLGKVLELHM